MNRIIRSSKNDSKFDWNVVDWNVVDWNEFDWNEFDWNQFDFHNNTKQFNIIYEFEKVISNVQSKRSI